MKEYRIFYILLSVIALTLCLAYQSKLTVVIFSVMLVLPFFSLIQLFVGYIFAKIQVTCDNTVLRKNEDGMLRVSVSKKLPLPHIRIHGTFHNYNSAGEYESLLIIGPEIKSFDLPLKFRYRGQYKIGCDYFDIYDALGLFRFRQKINGLFDIVVVPRDFEVLNISDKNEDDSDSGRFEASRLHNTVFSSLREYREGDNLRQIHWKLTAKQDELISKEMETPLNNSSVIFADFTQDFTHKETHMAVTDAIIETMLALTKKIIKDNNTAECFWQDRVSGRCESFSASGAEDYSRLFYTLSLIPTEGRADAFSKLIDLYPQKFSDKTVYFVLPSVTHEFCEIFDRLCLSRRKDVFVITFSKTERESSDYKYLQNQIGTQIEIADEEKIHETFLV